MNAPPTYFSLADLPQRGSIEKQAFGSGWWEFDRILKFYLGQFVVVTGLAGSGKSTLLLNILAGLARNQGMKSFLYVPENEAHLRDKLSKIWGNPDTFEHFANSQCFVQPAAPDNFDDRPHTLDWVLEKAAVAVERDKVEFVVIDPWNELDRAKPPQMLMTDYIGECLMLLKQFCRCLDAIVVVVAHPTKAVSEKGGRTPTLADIEGSMNWFNKCDNGLVVVRDVEKNQTRVISAKVREIGAGRIGTCYFDVDPATGIFTHNLERLMNTALALDRIEAILTEIEQLDAATGGQFRQPEAHEAFDIVARIERKMLRNQRAAE